MNSKNVSRKNSAKNSILGSEDSKKGHKRRMSDGSGNRLSTKRSKESKSSSPLAVGEIKKTSRNGKPLK